MHLYEPVIMNKLIFIAWLRCVPASVIRPSLVVAAALLLPATARADVSLNLSFWHGYGFYYPQLSLSSTTAPVTFHWIENASGTFWKQFGETNGSSGYSGSSLTAAINTCTNGLWKLYINRGHASQQLYYFAVNVSGVTTQVLGNVNITFPLNGATGIASTPTYTWTGPSNLAAIFGLSTHSGAGFNYGTTLPGSATNWTPGVLSPGANSLYLDYRSNNFPGITFTTPTNIVGNPVPDWSAQGDLHSYRYSDFTVASSGGGHTLKAHYSFENGGIFANDYSGNGNHIGILGSGSGGTRYTTNNPALGNFAAHFFNNSGAGYGSLKPPVGVLTNLAGSFTVSLWVRTTQMTGSDTDAGLSGNAGLVSAFSGPNWVVPMSLVSNKLAFVTSGSPQHTLRSTVPITNGSAFMHVAVTRNRVTGEKKIYVNGTLNATGTGSTDLFDTATELSIGYNYNVGTGFQGTMDEIQFYTGVLSAAEVAFLYANPGSTVPNTTGGGDEDLANAVDAPQFVWTTGGDAPWSKQSIETDDGVDAAQSGSIDHDEESWIETTIEGPGWVSFYWNVSSQDDEDGTDYLELTVDEGPEAQIYGDWGWDSYEVYVGAGSHTLRWTYHKDGDFTAGEDAAWLDEVSFAPEIEVELNLTIEHNNDPANPGYYALPALLSFSPNPVTSYEVESPSGYFFAYNDGLDENYSGYSMQGTLQQVIDEMEAGNWTLYINRNHANERQFFFTVSVNQLTTTNLPPVTITSPAEDATGVANNHVFTWTGPTNFTSLFLSSTLVTNVFTSSGGNTNLSPNATSTVFPNPLLPGTNSVFINYRRNSYSGVTLSDPETASFETLSSWSYSVSLVARQTRRFVVGDAGTSATPVQILNPQSSGTDFSLAFLTQAGRAHTVQSRTNLTTAPWMTLTNFMGDGNLWQLILPVGSTSENYFRVVTQ